MSLYNALFGKNPLSTTFLKVLGLTEDKVPRFRDCYLDDDRIVVYTRTGGGNRDYYENEESCRENFPEYFGEGKEEPDGPWNDDLRAHPCFISDEDSDFDSTYAYFYFKYPDEYAEDLKAIAKTDRSWTPSDKWKSLL
jgi:hypothetical protein